MGNHLAIRLRTCFDPNVSPDERSSQYLRIGRNYHIDATYGPRAALKKFEGSLKADIDYPADFHDALYFLYATFLEGSEQFRFCLFTECEGELYLF